jgi:hypothetical protein
MLKDGTKPRLIGQSQEPAGHDAFLTQDRQQATVRGTYCLDCRQVPCPGYMCRVGPLPNNPGRQRGQAWLSPGLSLDIDSSSKG